jgi:hypothetical protein
MNTAAGLHGVTRNQLWAEAANCATDLDCLVVKKNGQRTPFEMFYGKLADYGPHLRTFGEVGVTRNITTVSEEIYGYDGEERIPAHTC